MFYKYIFRNELSIFYFNWYNYCFSILEKLKYNFSLFKLYRIEQLKFECSIYSFEIMTRVDAKILISQIYSFEFDTMR